MKPTKKIEAAVLDVYHKWLHSYLNGDVKTYDSYFDNSFHFIGSTNNEEFLTRKDTTNFFKATAEQLAGKTQLRNETKIIEQFGELVFITHLFDAWFLNGNDWSFYGRFRFSNILEQNEDGWHFVYQHYSTPDSKAQDGETIGFNQITKENLELREAIQRRTVELEEKNKELEIEGSLERIRAKALAMTSSEDLLDVVVTLRTEFLKLGHEAHYFWHMMWLPDKYKKAMTSGDGTRIGMVMELPRHIHGKIPLLANWEKSTDPMVIYTMDAESAIDYVDKMITLGDFKQVDPQAPTHDDIRHIGGLTFIMARTTHGEIGYSLPGVVKNPPEEDLDILVQFAGAFDLAHRRFLDLQKAEKQAREVQIELALEKVRSRTMAMQHSDELQEASFLLDQQVRALGIKTRGCAFNIYGQNDATEWFSSEEGTMPVYRTPRENVFLEYYEAGKRGESLYIKEFEGDACAAHYDYLCTLPVMGTALRELKANGGSFPEKQIDHATFFKYGYLLFITLDFVPEAHDIFKRFAKVFEQTYTRFLDLQKAEAQAREAQIETALERVRSRTMAMQNSEELEEVILEVLKKLQGLGISMEQRAAAIFTYEAGNKDYTQWVASPEYSSILSFNTPYFDHPVQHDIWNARQNGTVFYAKPYPVEVKNSLFKYMFDLPALKNMPKAEKTKALKFKHYAISIAFQKHAALVVVDHSGIPLTEAENSILIRLSKVFNQTYTRFLDLQKAEDQARESQIQLSLERVRAKSMAMQSSSELETIIQVVHDQFVELGITLDHAGFIIDYKSNDDMIIWLADEHKVTPQIRLPYFDSPHWNSFITAKEKGHKLFVNHLDFKTKNKFYKQIFKYVPELPEDARSFYLKIPSLTIATSLIDNIGLYIENFSGVQYQEEDQKVLLRFGEEFQQAYTRFLDLQKAEAQAREAQIEAALEKVRSRSMGMQKSTELLEVILVVSEQLQALGFRFSTVSFLNNNLEDDYSFWVAPYGLPEPVRFSLPYKDIPMIRKLRNAQKKKLSFFTDISSLKEHQEWFQHLLKNSDKNAWTKEISDYQMSKGLARSVSIHPNIMLAIANNQSLPYSDYENKIIARFGQVFEQSYTRFLDLEKAEAQAREAQIEAALEKVRSRSLEMSKSSEMQNVANEILEQVRAVGLQIDALAMSGVIDNDSEYDIWVGGANSKKPLRIPYNNETQVQREFNKAIKERPEFFAKTYTGKVMKDYFKALMGTGNSFNPEIVAFMKTCTGFTTTLTFMKNSGIQLIRYSQEAFSIEDNAVIVRFGKVFEQAYIRFLDLQKAEEQTILAQQNLIKLQAQKQLAEEALSELQQTQTQLIQSEKMASLGELTAGIAHEIQNPLNFVNNFSEVSKELLEEMQEEIENGDFEEVKAIMNDVIQNLEKINHHGKRADGIVKGMLQHSRSSIGTKEPTDINALADEYLRLAYHGLRAKDKSFNATLETDFDKTIGKVSVIPQDIGRVILNLITNAFYAVNEKKQEDKDFNPVVSVSTKKIGDHIEIKVVDNGKGIPKAIVDKIFQPFFTTKPTGQGTGLGLSMSYDIVTKGHGGSLTVISSEGKGSEFSFTLPALA